MNVLVLNFLLLHIYAFIFLYLYKDRRSKKIFIIAVTVQMIVLNGLRSRYVGVDTLRYEKRFIEISQNTDIPRLTDEPAYDFLQQIVVFYTDNFHVWLFIVSVFIFTALGYFIYRYSSNYYLSYILLITLDYFDFAFSGIRQMIAMVIILFTFKYVIEKKLSGFLLIVFIASLFHLSAVVVLPLYFIVNLDWDKTNLSIIFFSYMIIFLLRYDIGWVFLNLYYRSDMEMVARFFNPNTIGRLSLFILGLVILGVIITNPFKCKERTNIVLINIMLFSFVIQSFSSVSYLFTRLNMYYLFFIILYVPNLFINLDKLPKLLNRVDRRYYEVIIKIIIVVVLTIYYVNATQVESNILPYSFFWM